jgi:hypothetical protein
MYNTILFIHLFHIFIVGGLFLYVATNRESTPKIIFTLLTILGIVIIIYHSYKTYIKFSKNINPWVNLFHIFIVAPLIIYIGVNGDKTKRPYFELLLLLAFASIGYHFYYMIYN